jgi:feruloyl esterase
MFKAIKDIKSRHPTAGIVITGHSLGASMATLAAAAIKTTLNFDRITFYTFGSPRTGN